MPERTHPETPFSVREFAYVPTTDGTYVDTSFLQKRFYESELGTFFSTQTPRFVKRHAELSDEDALLYLGGDACPVHHQLELAEIHLQTVLDAEYQNGTLFMPGDEDIGLLYFAAMFHDIGESEHESLREAGVVTVGDIPHGEKTDLDRQNEAIVRRQLYRAYFTDIDPYFIERVEAIIMHRPLEGDEHLHDIYEAAHDLQVFATVDTASENAHNLEVPSHVRAALGRFAHQVTHGNDEHPGHLETLRTRSYFTAIETDVRRRDEQHTDDKLAHFVTESNWHLHQKCCLDVA